MGTIWLAGQVMAGGWVSFTVTVKLQLSSDAVSQVSGVVPTGKKDPDGGLHENVGPQPPTLVGAA